jgi:hypothetical protein
MGKYPYVSLKLQHTCHPRPNHFSLVLAPSWPLTRIPSQFSISSEHPSSRGVLPRVLPLPSPHIVLGTSMGSAAAVSAPRCLLPHRGSPTPVWLRSTTKCPLQFFPRRRLPTSNSSPRLLHLPFPMLLQHPTCFPLRRHLPQAASCYLLHDRYLACLPPQCTIPPLPPPTPPCSVRSPLCHLIRRTCSPSPLK